MRLQIKQSQSRMIDEAYFFCYNEFVVSCSLTTSLQLSSPMTISRFRTVKEVFADALMAMRRDLFHCSSVVAMYHSRLALTRGPKQKQMFPPEK